MKFTYDDANLSEVINYYFTDEDFLYVKYLDGYFRPYVKEKEPEIQAKMLEQARERAEKMDIEKMKKEVILQNVTELSTICLALSTSVASLTADEYYAKLLFLVLTVLSAIYSVQYYQDIIKNRSNKACLEELEKYKIYLDNCDDIAKYQDNPDLYRRVKLDNLNINTLDNFSLKDLYQINANLSLLIYKDNKPKIKKLSK